MVARPIFERLGYDELEVVPNGSGLTIEVLSGDSLYVTVIEITRTEAHALAEAITDWLWS